MGAHRQAVTLDAYSTAAMQLKPRKCKHCSEKYTPTRPMQSACSVACAIELGKKARAKADAVKAREEKATAKTERESVRKRKQALETRGDVLKQAKVAIQAFRRLEELSKGRGCISCGRSQQEVEAGEWRPGGYWDGGHFKSKGAFPEMALEPLNIWLQCKSCNAGSGKYARKGYTVNASFEVNLVALEGQELVDWLNGPHAPKHYDIDQLRAIRDEYRAKAAKLKKKKRSFKFLQLNIATSEKQVHNSTHRIAD